MVRFLLTVLLLAGLFGGGFGLPAQARQDVRLSTLCLNAISHASRKSGVPAKVMLAIALSETGRKMEGALRPWPWTMNVRGKGYWFDSREEAIAFAKLQRAKNEDSFDSGCFQINYRWHHQHFSSLEAMFDPQINADYAARFLGELYAEKGSWAAAAGAYHSRTPKYATRYAQRFARHLARLEGRTTEEVLGNGSEPIRLAAVAVAPRAAPKPVRPPPEPFGVPGLRPGEEMNASPAPRGSLFSARASAGQGLLRAGRGTLY